MSLVVVATVKPTPAERAAVIAAFEAAIESVHTEDDGCELYALHEAPDRLVMIEKWASEADLVAHSQGRGLTALAAALDGKLDGDMDVQILQPHPAGSAEQGTL